VVSILGKLVPTYGTFDVLSDPDVRDGIKEYSDWPTIPQLYIAGEFVGGCDIIQEMYASGELQEALGLPKPDPASLSVTITPAASEVLREARERAGAGAALHLSIDARFESALGLGDPQPGEIAVESNGLTLLIDPDSAHRANGVTIDAVQTEDGPRLTIDNPNAPQA
jgi:monothiol glutaredoxin